MLGGKYKLHFLKFGAVKAFKEISSVVLNKTILVWFIALVAFGELHAKYVQTCKVKYKRNYDWSEYYTVDVTFMTGAELNRATSTFNYDGFGTYAIIFWDEGEASVIKISTYVACGVEVRKTCISSAYMNLEGEDQDGRGWEICVKDFCY